MGSAPSPDLDLVVIGGCGHVGLPLALSFADAGYRVGIYDTDQTKLETVSSGQMPFMETGASELLARMLAAERLEFSADSSMLSRSMAVVLIIGTPVDEHLNPTFHAMRRFCTSIESIQRLTASASSPTALARGREPTMWSSSTARSSSSFSSARLKRFSPWISWRSA